MLSELERLSAPPAAADLEEEGLAAWEASFEHDRQIWGELLAENVDRLERGSYSLHWTDTTDIHWGDLEPASEDLEKAACQFSTFLSEVEFVAGDFPSRWIYKIPQDFFEVKNFLVTQMMDEARHMEVFRKRALAGGGGLLHASPSFQWSM